MTTGTHGLTALQIARLYALRGFRPIPLRGKRPFINNWERFSATPPTDFDLISMFHRHSGNVGSAVPEGYVVLDVDMHNFDGIAALFKFEREQGQFPDTLTAITGSDGQHFWFKLPDGVTIKAGGAIAGYPGLEFKGPRGQVVLAPSIHPDTGQPYQWDLAGHPDDIPLHTVPEVPQPLLAAILADPIANGAPTKPDGSKGRLSDDQVRAVFDATYVEGERRSGKGLPRVVSLLRARGVAADEAVEFFVRWQEAHFDPPLDADEAERHVRDMYRRYGHPEAEREIYGARFLDWLQHPPAANVAASSDAARAVISVPPPITNNRPHDGSLRDLASFIAANDVVAGADKHLLDQAIDLFPIDPHDDKLTGAAHAIRRPKEAHHRASLYTGGYSTTWDPQYGQNVAKRRQEQWAKNAAVIRALYERGYTLHWYEVEWEHAEIGKDNVARATDLERKRCDRARTKYRKKGEDRTAAYAALDLAGQEATWVFSTEPSTSAEQLGSLDEALGLLEIAVRDMGVGKFIGYKLRAKAVKHSKEWACDLPRTENNKNETIGTLPDSLLSDGVEHFVQHVLKPEADIRGLTAYIEGQDAVQAIDAVDLLAKVTLVASQDDPDGSWWVLDCWKAVGANLRPAAYEEWRQNTWRRTKKRTA